MTCHSHSYGAKRTGIARCPFSSGILARMKRGMGYVLRRMMYGQG
ncbi:MAG TPA: hypothetical protein VLQ91_22630 [Draconibacterium sp.]|nr:hypothetical protein [Draconibacterium sp.]